MTKSNEITIRQLKPGQKVKVPGLYLMDINTYHSDCADAPSFSSGDLAQIFENGRKYWYKSYYNPDAPAQQHHAHLNFGNLVHAEVVGGGEQQEFIERPHTWKTWGAQAAKDWRMREERNGKTVIVKGDLEKAKAMAKVALNDPTANELFAGGIPEVSIFVKFQDIWIKARPDVIPYYDRSIITDYKTIYDNSERECAKQNSTYNYDQKIANIAWCMMQLPEMNMPAFSELVFALIYQSTDEPHDITPYPFSNHWIKLLASRNIEAMHMAAHGMRTGQWEGVRLSEPEFKGSYGEPNKIETAIAENQLPALDDNLNVIGGKTYDEEH